MKAALLYYSLPVISYIEIRYMKWREMIQKIILERRKSNNYYIFSCTGIAYRDYNQRNIKRMKIIELRFHQMLKSQQEKFAIILDINNT